MSLKQNILVVLILTTVFSFIFYYGFNSKKSYKDYWNIYMPSSTSISTINYASNLNIISMKYSRRQIKKLLKNTNFKQIDNEIYDIYNYFKEEDLKQYIDLKNLISNYNYYLLLAEEENTANFDLLLLNTESCEVLSINNCRYKNL